MASLDENYACADTVDLLDMVTLVDPRLQAPIHQSRKGRGCWNEIGVWNHGWRPGLGPGSQAGPGREQQTKVQKEGYQRTTSAIGLEKETKFIGELLLYTPLDWWRKHEHNFSRLSRMAKKNLCIPTISTPSYFPCHFYCLSIYFIIYIYIYIHTHRPLY